jgi:hypothetical protein
VVTPVQAPAHPGELWLSAVEFDAVWEVLGLGDRPSVLALPSPGRTVDERRRLLATVLDRLRDRGLVPSRPGTGPHRWVAEILEVLARPRQVLELYFTGDRIAIAAVAGQRATLAARHGDHLWAVGMSPGQVVPAMIDMLGEVTPGVARPVNLPAQVLDDAREAAARMPDATMWTVADELTSRGVRWPDASSLARIYAGVHGVGQFTSRGVRDGRSRPGPWAVGVHRNDSGFFVGVRRRDPAGESFSVAPVDAPRLARHLDELLCATP